MKKNIKHQKCHLKILPSEKKYKGYKMLYVKVKFSLCGDFYFCLLLFYCLSFLHYFFCLSFILFLSIISLVPGVLSFRSVLHGHRDFGWFPVSVLRFLLLGLVLLINKLNALYIWATWKIDNPRSIILILIYMS